MKLSSDLLRFYTFSAVHVLLLYLFGYVIVELVECHPLDLVDWDSKQTHHKCLRLALWLSRWCILIIWSALTNCQWNWTVVSFKIKRGEKDQREEKDCVDILYSKEKWTGDLCCIQLGSLIWLYFRSKLDLAPNEPKQQSADRLPCTAKDANRPQAKV